MERQIKAFVDQLDGDVGEREKVFEDVGVDCCCAFFFEFKMFTNLLVGATSSVVSTPLLRSKKRHIAAPIPITSRVRYRIRERILLRRNCGQSVCE